MMRPIAGCDLRVTMPIVRYFLLTGSVLLALLFVADRYLPPPFNRLEPIDVDRTIIRIRSARNLPEKIVFDTAHPPVVTAAAPLEVEVPAERTRQALAMASDDATPPVRPWQSSAALASVQRHVVRLRRVVRRAPERQLAAEHRDFFGGW